MRARIVLVYVAIAFLWGSTWSVIRIGLDHLPPLRFAGMRMALAAALLAPFALRGGAWRVLVGAAGGAHRARRPLPDRAPLRAHVRGAAVGALRARRASSSRPSRSGSRSSPACFLPGERLTPAQLASAALGVAGVPVLQAPAPRASSRLRPARARERAHHPRLDRRRARERARPARTSSRLPARHDRGADLRRGGRAPRRGAPPRAGRPASYTPAALGALAYLAVFGTALTYIGLYWLVPRVPDRRDRRAAAPRHHRRGDARRALLGESIGWHLAVGGGMVLAAAALATRDAPRAPDAG